MSSSNNSDSITPITPTTPITPNSNSSITPIIPITPNVLRTYGLSQARYRQSSTKERRFWGMVVSRRAQAPPNSAQNIGYIGRGLWSTYFWNFSF